MTLTVAILAACILDCLFGDPQQMLHPVVLMGRCISGMERFLRRRFPATKEGELAAGRIIAVVLPAAVFALAFAACRVCLLLHPILYFCLEAFWGYQALAARSLAGEAEKVRKSLTGETGQERKSLTGETGQERKSLTGEAGQERKSLTRETNQERICFTGEAEKESSSMEGESCRRKDRLSSARRQVARIVGRDTEKLDEAGIIRACVETVAENSSDGVTAPLFYLLIGGAPLALAYKAVNTMDSMIGYRNDRYLFFGRAAARLDDCFNFLPSRITALLWIVAAALVPFADAGQAWRIFRRDRKKHASPNAAQTESACAGALHIRLAGPASYFGRRMEKPWIGDDDKPVEPEDIRRSVWLMWISSALALAIGIAVRVLLRKMTFHV